MPGRTRDPQYFLAAAVYAYVFLFPDDHAKDPLPYDPRLRLAMDLYNRAVTNGLRAPKGGGIDLSPRRLPCPSARLIFPPIPPVSPMAAISSQVSSRSRILKSMDFRNHYRKPGIGAALSARVKPIAGQAASPWISPQVKVPVTAFVRFEQPRQALNGGRDDGKN